MSDPQCASGLCTTEDICISKCHLWRNFVSLLLTGWCWEGVLRWCSIGKFYVLLLSKLRVQPHGNVGVCGGETCWELLISVFDTSANHLMMLWGVAKPAFICCHWLRQCAVLLIGRSLVRFQMVSLEFFIDIILPIALWPCAWFILWQKWVPGVFPGGKKRPVHKADNLTAILGHYHVIWEP